MVPVSPWKALNMQQHRVTLERYLDDGDRPDAAARVAHAALVLGSVDASHWWAREMLALAVNHGVANATEVRARFGNRADPGGVWCLVGDDGGRFAVVTERRMLDDDHAVVAVRNTEQLAVVNAVLEVDRTFAERNPEAPEVVITYADAREVVVHQLIALGIDDRNAEVHEALKRLRR